VHFGVEFAVSNKAHLGFWKKIFRIIFQYSITLTLLVAYQLWYISFYPHDYSNNLNKYSSFESFYYLSIAHIFLLLFLYLFFKYWTFFRDVIYFSLVLMATGHLAEVLDPYWEKHECNIRAFLNINSSSAEKCVLPILIVERGSTNT